MVRLGALVLRDGEQEKEQVKEKKDVGGECAASRSPLERGR
jgi:hypothetical protein